jgi:hypothetical protein
MSHIETSPVDMFITLRPRLLCGLLLQDVKAMQASIARFGLLSPIVVSRANDRLVVVDGRKRLAAIRRLSFMGRLPRSLVNIPYVEVQAGQNEVSQTPSLMSNRELYCTVADMYREHRDVDLIATELFLPRGCVRQILTLSCLSKRVRRAFFDKVIGFTQARAFATLPDHKAQDKAFLTLGPFAEEADILDYIQAGSKKVPAANLSLAA